MDSLSIFLFIVLVFFISNSFIEHHPHSVITETFHYLFEKELGICSTDPKMSLWQITERDQPVDEVKTDIAVHDERVTGILTVNGEIIHGNQQIDGNLLVNGTTTLNGTTIINATETVNGNLNVNGLINGVVIPQIFPPPVIPGPTVTLLPQITNTYDVGSNVDRYQNLYLNGNASINGTVNGVTIPQPATIPGPTVTLTPQITNTYDVGSSLLQYNNLFLSQQASFDNYRLTNFVDAFVRQTVTFNIVNTGLNDIVGWTHDTGSLSGFNLVTGVFTAPTNGIYFMNVDIFAPNGIGVSTKITILFSNSANVVQFGTTTLMDNAIPAPSYAFLGNAQIMLIGQTIKVQIRSDTSPMNGVQASFKLLRNCNI